MALALSLAACLPGGSDDDDAAVQIEFTNPAGITEIQTPDIVVNITGKVSSEHEIEMVTWTNDRGGKGEANGTEQFATGNIVLQTGPNNIEITATDVLGGTNSKTLTVLREDPSAPNGGFSAGDTEMVAMYSYASDLSNAAPVDGASLKPGLVHFFLEPDSASIERGISQVRYDCCQGIAGPGQSTPDSPTVINPTAPWKMSVNLTSYQPGSTHRLRAYIVFNDGQQSNQESYDFTIAGAAVTNSAPVISGSPVRTATVGNQYNFRPVGQDADGDTMRFSIRNKPEWATFSETTGRLFGTPKANHVGTHGGIRISVSDGKASSSLPEFAIEVEAISLGTTTLQWSAPTERTDNTPLMNELAGYNLYYGQTSRDYANKIPINGAGVTTYVVENLSAGRWYFVVTAVDDAGIESNPSNEAMRSF